MIIKLRPEDIRRYNWYIWKTLIAFVALFILLLVVTYFGLFGPLPSFRAIENPKSNQASEVLAADKSVLGTYYVQNRSSVNYSQLSPNVVNALIATEDVRFKEHSGIDFQRLPGIVFFTMIGKKQGASTITQQLARQTFNLKERSYKRKLLEAFVAQRIEDLDLRECAEIALAVTPRGDLRAGEHQGVSQLRVAIVASSTLQLIE